MSGVYCIDCNSKLRDDGPCPCCERSYAEPEDLAAPPATAPAVRWVEILTRRGRVLARLTDRDWAGGVPTIDLRDLG